VTLLYLVKQIAGKPYIPFIFIGKFSSKTVVLHATLEVLAHFLNDSLSNTV
jgi:hypothetical protein